MKKIFGLMIMAALAVALCVSGCKPKGGEAKKDDGKTAGAATGTVAAPGAPAGGVAAFGDEICKAVTGNTAAFGGLFSVEFTVKAALTAEQEKAMPAGQLEKTLKESEEMYKTGMVNEKDKPENCKVVEAKDVACDEIYTKIDTEGNMGQKPAAAGRAKEIGEALKIESCGLLTISATKAGKEEPIEWGVGTVKGKYAILAGFEIKKK